MGFKDPARAVAYKSAWAKANRARLRIKQRKQYADNLEAAREEGRRKNRKYAATKRAWERKNRERLNAKGRALYARQIEKQRERHRNRPESYRIKQKARSRARYQERRDEYRQWQAQYRAQNLERVREKARRWAKENRAYGRAQCAKWTAAKFNACPKWVDMDAMLAIYAEAHRITRETGIKHDVDHIIPLQSDIVCGLHVPWNLQILTKSDNVRKSNRLSCVSA
jgi:hypothetical protein